MHARAWVTLMTCSQCVVDHNAQVAVITPQALLVRAVHLERDVVAYRRLRLLRVAQMPRASRPYTHRALLPKAHPIIRPLAG